MGLTMEQRAMRRNGIGASEIAAIAGLNPWRGPHDVWLEKSGLSEPFAGNEATKAGERLEPVVASWYTEETARAVWNPERTFRHPSVAFALATPDRFVLPAGAVGLDAEVLPGWPSLLRPDALLEIKTSRSDEGWGEPGTDQIPPYYLAQVEWQLWVLRECLGRDDLDRVDVACLFGGQRFRLYEVRWNPALALELLRIGDEFWTKHVQANVPPAVDGSPAAARALQARFPRHTQDTLLRADAEAERAAGALRQARVARKAAEAAEAIAENVLKERIGAAAGVEGVGWRVTWKAARDAVRTDWKAVVQWADVPRGLIDEHTTTTPSSRRFLARFDNEEGEQG